MDGEVLTEVPSNLQMLVRLVVRGFYAIEDVLIVDMLVRNLCKLYFFILMDLFLAYHPTMFLK